MGKNIIEKVWEQHVVHREDGKPDLLYIDLHLIHEVAFAFMLEKGKELGLVNDNGNER